ncbi:MAG: hypothetical protein ACLUN0_04075 [Roseburia sp.]
MGYLGEVHPTVAANYNPSKISVYVAVIDMPEIVSGCNF